MSVSLLSLSLSRLRIDVHSLSVSEMLEKLSDAVVVVDPCGCSLEVQEEYRSKTFDQLSKEYSDLLPEYNHLFEYIQSIANKFSSLEEDFRHEQVFSSSFFAREESLRIL